MSLCRQEATMVQDIRAEGSGQMPLHVGLCVTRPRHRQPGDASETRAAERF